MQFILNSLQKIYPLNFESLSAHAYNAGSFGSPAVDSAAVFTSFFYLQSLDNPTRQQACPFALLATRVLHASF